MVTFPRPLLALLPLLSLASGDDAPSSTITAAPVFLPYYDAESWSLVRGSIISSDAEASETTYTIFCPTATTPACDLALEFPFVIVEGPSTVQFHGTYTSTYIANVECELDNKTAATCSGYSSYKSGYSNGLHTGPTQISWTSTLSGTDVEWGMLTLTDKPSTTNDVLGLTGTAPSTPPPSMTITVSTGIIILPTPTDQSDGDGDGEGAGTSLRADKRWAILAALTSVFAARWML